MVNFQNKQIFDTLKKYQNNYNILLNSYLKQHEDFDELMFIDDELAFYNLCYINSNVVLGNLGNGPEYCINGGNYEILLSSIYNSLVNYSDEYNGFDLELSIKYKASFTKIIAFLEEKKVNTTTGSSNSFSVINEKITTALTFNDNLVNDPLFNPKNEYMTLKETFIEDIRSKTAHLNNPNDFFIQEFDGDLQDWENEQKEKINTTFLRLVKELNQNKIFFFGCSLDNYKRKYMWRLGTFLEHYTDACEVDFIEDELKFLENILYDLQNTEGADNGFSQSGKDNYSKAYEFVSIVGYKHYFFSHNKKVDFLKGMLEFVLQQNELSKPMYYDPSSINDEQDQLEEVEVSKQLNCELNTSNTSASLPQIIAIMDEKNYNNIQHSTAKKIPAKYHALAYILELLADKNKPPSDFDGSFKKDEIVRIGRERCNDSGQSFYNYVKDYFETVSNHQIKKSIFKGWKEIVVQTSINKLIIEEYIKNNNL